MHSIIADNYIEPQIRNGTTVEQMSYAATFTGHSSFEKFTKMAPRTYSLSMYVK